MNKDTRGPHGETARCTRCNWPLVASARDGCVPGNCSYRPAVAEREDARLRAAAHLERAAAVAAQAAAEREARAPRGPACDVCDGAEPPDASEDQGQPFAVTDRPCPACAPRAKPRPAAGEDGR